MLEENITEVVKEEGRRQAMVGFGVPRNEIILWMMLTMRGTERICSTTRRSFISSKERERNPRGERVEENDDVV
jgi:hypothetical protein